MMVCLTIDALIFWVLKCQDHLTILFNSENMNSPLTMRRVGMDCLLVFLYFMVFIFYIWFVTACDLIQNKLEIIFLYQSSTTTSRISGNQEFGREQLEMGADFPPGDELFDKNMNEDDDNLPCNEVDCPTEIQAVVP